MLIVTSGNPSELKRGKNALSSGPPDPVVFLRVIIRNVPKARVDVAASADTGNAPGPPAHE
jgi:hypothetical protein